MIEFIKHLTGACGEPHVSLLTIIASTPIIGYILYQLKNTPSFFSKSIWTWNEHVLGGVLTNLIKKNIISYEDVYGDLHFFIKIDEVKLNKILYS